MKYRIYRSRVFWSINRSAWALICAAALLPAEPCLLGYSRQESAAPPAQEAKIPPDQLDSLVAPIALYPDPLLAQLLADVVQEGCRDAERHGTRRGRDCLVDRKMRPLYTLDVPESYAEPIQQYELC